MSEAVSAGRAAAGQSGARAEGVTLFAVGFLVLFLELACIRWFAADVVFLQYFTNVVLIASFLGMSCGCLAAGQKRDWLSTFPFLAFAAVAAAIGMFLIYQRWSGLAVDVGHQVSPQMIFFGAESRNPDVAQFVVPIEALAAFFFVLIALMFVGPGQALGRAFDAYPDRIMGYTLNIGGSLAGIVVFSALSFVQTPPPVWFLVCAAGVGWLLRRQGKLTWVSASMLLLVVLAVSLPITRSLGDLEAHWSPYYSVTYDKNSRNIAVNTIGHQQIVPFAQGGASYSLIHLLQQHSGGAPFGDVLIIGAGSGNDLDHALRFGAKRIDAVEIDPAIQSIGFRHNPDHPYQDPRVVPHLDDGRHFLRTTNRKYDLVVYALVDSLIMHSSYANLRLESYLFTPEAFADARRTLKPGGTFVTYNFFRQGWIVDRIAAMATKAFGCPPVVISLPYKAVLTSEAPAGFTMIIAGCDSPIRAAFARHGSFWLNTSPPADLTIDGFAVQPQTLPPAAAAQFQQISPTALPQQGAPLAMASDDWPFLYLHGRLIPDFAVRSMLILGALGIGMVWLFMPRGRIALHNRMFFLGAAFMLLETRAVVEMALLFGSTWLVNSAVFFTVLVLVLLANLLVLRLRPKSVSWAYVGLFLMLGAGALIPTDTFIGGGFLWRYAAPCFLALGPMLFSGVIFARAFQDAPDPDLAFGSNIAGSVVGGLAESFSMILGFQHLLVLAMAFYALSIWTPRLRTALVTSR